MMTRQKHAYPLFYKIIIIIGVLLFSGAAVFSYQQNANPYLALGFGFFALLAAIYIHITFSVIITDESGITQRPPVGEKKFIPWERIQEISDVALLSRFDLHDGNGNRLLSFYSNIENFFDLIDTIEERMAGDLQKKIQHVFHGSAYAILLPAFLIGLTASWVIFLWETDVWWHKPAVLAVPTLFGFFIYIKEPRRLQIREDELIFEYPFRTQRISVEEIDTVSLEYTFGDYGSKSTVIKLELVSGKTIPIGSYKESNYRLFHSIKTIMNLDES